MDLDLRNHITNNNIDVKFVLMLNKIEERLITPCLGIYANFSIERL